MARFIPFNAFYFFKVKNGKAKRNTNMLWRKYQIATPTWFYDNYMGENCPKMYVYLLTLTVKYTCYALKCSEIPSLCCLIGSWELNSLIMNRKKCFRDVYQRKLKKHIFFHVYIINKRKVQVSGNKHIFLLVIFESFDVFLPNLKCQVSNYAAQLSSLLDINTNCHSCFTASKKVVDHISVWISITVFLVTF